MMRQPPPVGSHRPHEDEPDGDRDDGEDPRARDADSQLGVARPDEAVVSVDGEGRTSYEDVVQCLGSRERGTQQPELSQRGRLRPSAPSGEANAAGDERREQREHERDADDLADPRAHDAEQWQPEQVVAEIAAELGHVSVEVAAAAEEQPLLPVGAGRGRDADR